MRQNKEECPKNKIYDDKKHYEYLNPQLDVFNTIDDTVDYVTLTIGGNDVGFADIITMYATGSTYLHFGKSKLPLQKKIDELWDGFDTTRSNIKQTYKDISQAAGTLLSGNPFHVYYSHKLQIDGNVEICKLDYDDTTSYGPEHITLKATNDTPYYYYVYRYAGQGTVASSGAKVTVHQGNNLIADFNVPTDIGGDDYWNVFAIKNGELIIKNTITSSADIRYAR